MTTTIPITPSPSPSHFSFSSSIRRLVSRTGPITSDDKSTAVMVTTWSTLGLIVAVVLLRQAIRYLRRKRTNLDDVFILLATTFAIGLSVTTLILASEGLGVRGTLTPAQATIQMKTHYASDFLYVLSICFPKLALISFFHGVVVQRAERRITQIFGIFVIAWTLASLAAVAFQCSLPRPWEMMTLRCYNKGVFWIVYCIIDMTSEVGIVMLSVNLVAYLRVKLSRKLIIVACFAPRGLVVAAALTRLVFLYPIEPGNNPAFNLWVPVVCTQIHVCVSIATACIPYIKPIFEGLLVPGSHGTNQPYVQGHMKEGAGGAAHDDMYSFDSSPSLNYTHGGVGAVKRSAGTGAGAAAGGRHTPDISPRVPSLVPLSPLTPPRYVSPSESHPNSPATPKSRSPSERGLKLHIPQGAFINTSKFSNTANQNGICTIEITPPQHQIQNQHQVGHAHPQSALTSDIVSPQTASSHTLSPGAEGLDGLEGLSPQPLLAGFQAQSLTPPLPSKTVFPRIPRNSQVPQLPQNSKATKIPKVPRIPSASYSLIPQITPIPPPTIPAIPNSRNRPTSTTANSNRRLSQAKEPRREPQTVVSPTTQTPLLDVEFPPRLSSKQAHAHPLHRYRAHYAASASPSNTMSPISPSSTPTSMPTSKLSSMPIAPTSVPQISPPVPRNPKFSTAPDPKKPSPTVTIPTYYVRTTSSPLSPPTGRNTGSSFPSYYINTPPTTSPPSFPLPSPPLQSPGSRVRNQRVLAPSNNSRGYPVNSAWHSGTGDASVRSPISPLTATTISPTSIMAPKYNTVPTPRSGRGRFPVRPSSISADAAAAMHPRRRTGTMNSITSPVSPQSRDPIASPNSSRMRTSRPWVNHEDRAREDRNSYISEDEILMRAGSEQVRIRPGPGAQGRQFNAQEPSIGHRGRW